MLTPSRRDPIAVTDQAFLSIALRRGAGWADPILFRLTPPMRQVVIGRSGIPGTATEGRVPVQPDGFRTEEVPSRGLVLSLGKDCLEARIQASDGMWEAHVKRPEGSQPPRIDAASMRILYARDQLFFGYRLSPVSPLVTVAQVHVHEAPGSALLPQTETPLFRSIVAKVTRAWRDDLFGGDDPTRWSSRGRMLAGIDAARQQRSSLDLKDLRTLYIGSDSNNYDKPTLTWKHLNGVARNALTVGEVSYLETTMRLPSGDLVQVLLQIGNPGDGHIDHRHFAEILAQKLRSQGAMPVVVEAWAKSVLEAGGR